MKPWEKYAQQSQEAPVDGPWTRYQASDVSPAQPAPQSPAEPRIEGGVIVPPAYEDQGPAQPSSMGAKDYIRQGSDVAGDMLAAGAAGVSRGITGMADLPGMAIGGAGNLLAAGIDRTGLAPEGFTQGMRDSFDMMPMGDGDLFSGAASDATGGASEFRGDTTPGRYAGTVGEFLPGAMIGGGGPVRNALAFGVIPGLASEGAGQLTEGTAAEPWARAIAPIVAGTAASMMTRPRGPQAPSVDDLRTQADDLYRAGAARPGADQAGVQGLAAQIDNELQALNIKTPTGRVVVEGNVKRFLDVLDDFKGQPMKPEQMQSLRRILTDAAGSADPADRRIGARLLEQFDQWRGQHVPEYAQADRLYGRMKRAQDVDWRLERATDRAASTGTGGNQVNAARQNIRRITDSPTARRGYSAEELDMMQRIVRGDRATNTLRAVGKLSPTSGALPLMGSIVGTGVNPLAGTAAMAVSAGSKGLAEMLTTRQINALAATIRNGGPVARNALAGLDDAAIALLAARAASAETGRP